MFFVRDAEKSSLEVHPYSNYIESFKQKSLDRILHIFKSIRDKSIKGIKAGPSSEYTDSYNWLLIGFVYRSAGV